jgi:hypothetical protein
MTEHRMTAIGLAIGILGAAAGVYFPLRSQFDAERQNQTHRIAERQRAMDAIYQRLGNDEAAIAALASQLPQDKRDILNAVRAAQKQAQDQQAQEPVLYDKSIPFDGTSRQQMKKMLEKPAMPAANVPKEERPQ